MERYPRELVQGEMPVIRGLSEQRPLSLSAQKRWILSTADCNGRNRIDLYIYQTFMPKSQIIL